MLCFFCNTLAKQERQKRKPRAGNKVRDGSLIYQARVSRAATSGAMRQVHNGESR
jgi:hypothetical protein